MMFCLFVVKYVMFKFEWFVLWYFCVNFLYDGYVLCRDCMYVLVIYSFFVWEGFIFSIVLMYEFGWGVIFLVVYVLLM